MALSPNPMYIRNIRIQNIKGIDTLQWKVPNDVRSPGWHVIIGNNGSGKTTLLKATALALLGYDAPLSLRIAPNTYIRRGSRGSSSCEVWEESGKRHRWDANRKLSSQGSPAATGFHASFGANRRFVGGFDTMRLQASDPVTARHVSLFDPSGEVSDVIGWMKDLAFEAHDDGEARFRLKSLKSFINQPGFLPSVTLDTIQVQGPVFIDAAGTSLGITDLSAGYQSAILLVLELLRKALQAFPSKALFRTLNGREIVDIPGTVLVDEIDSHLHPAWQQRIGQFLCTYLPSTQFIVTTHSPLVCRASLRGSVFKLPSLGEPGEGQMVGGENRMRLLYGDVLDAFGTELFGSDLSRSAQGQEKFDRLAELNIKAQFSDSLTEAETEERSVLRNLLILESPR